MFYQKTKKIMTNGIEKYSKLFNTKSTNIQILFVTNGEAEMKYKICVGYQPRQDVTFLDILDKRTDIFHIEAIATPHLIKSAEMYKKQYESEGEVDVMIFLYDNPRNEDRPILSLGIFVNKVMIRKISLQKQFERLGL